MSQGSVYPAPDDGGRGVPPSVPRDKQEETLRSHLQYAVAMSRGDEDLHQELALAAWSAIREGTPASKIVVTMWRQRSRYFEGYLCADKYGKSIDRGLRQQRRADGRTCLNSGEDAARLEPMVLEAVSHVRNPARLALFNVACERFLVSLSPSERQYWDLRAAGYRDQTCCGLWSQETCTAMKRRLRRRFHELVES